MIDQTISHYQILEKLGEVRPGLCQAGTSAQLNQRELL